MTRISRMIFAAALLASLATSAHAEKSNNRMLIVNGNNGHVIYDDGRDDLYCVTRKRFVGRDDWGRPIYRRKMRCR
jgi:hypothetical protein